MSFIHTLFASMLALYNGSDVTPFHVWQKVNFTQENENRSGSVECREYETGLGSTADAAIDCLIVYNDKTIVDLKEPKATEFVLDITIIDHITTINFVTGPRDVACQYNMDSQEPAIKGQCTTIQDHQKPGEIEGPKIRLAGNPVKMKPVEQGDVTFEWRKSKCKRRKNALELSKRTGFGQDLTRIKSKGDAKSHLNCRRLGNSE